MTLTLPHWAIYYRSSTGTTWTEISTKVNYKGLEWSERLSDKVSFTVPVIFKKNDTILDIQPGDFIAICKDSTRYEIADNILVGIVDNPNKEISAIDYTNFLTEPYEIIYSLECTGWDFSEPNITSYEYKQSSLSTILSGILLNDSNQLLGGIINGVTIPKYSLKIADITVDSFKAIEKSAYEAVQQLCEENGLYFKIVWYSQPITTFNLRIAAQIIIFDFNGLQPKNAFWNDTGITDQSLQTGRTVNPNYATNTLLNQYLPTIRKPKIKEDQSNIRNYILFDGHYSDAGAFDRSTSALQRYETTAKGVNNDVYYLPYPAFDIYSGGFLISGYVTSATTPSTTQFSINAELSGAVVIGDKILINKSTDFRTVSNVSGNLITISVALPSAPTAGQIFEVIQQDWITIYDENENTSIYSSRGFAKDLKLDQPAKIRWLADRSIPPPDTILVFYYWPAIPYKRVIKLNDSIIKYGLKRADIKSDTIFTKTQIDSLIASFENQTPNKTLELISYLPVSSGDIIPVNLTGFCTENLMISDVKGKYGGVKGYEIINIYEISMSNNYKEDFNDLLRRLTSQANFKNSGSDNEINKIAEKISINITFEVTASVPVQVEKMVYESSQSGTTQIYISNLDGSGEVRLTNNAYNDTKPTLYNNYVTYLTTRHGNAEIYLLNLATMTEVRVTNNVYVAHSVSQIDSDFDTLFYSDDRDGTTNHEVFKYVISTATETRLTTSVAPIDNQNPFIADNGFIYWNQGDTRGSSSGSDIRRMTKAGASSTSIRATTTQGKIRLPRVNVGSTNITYASDEYASPVTSATQQEIKTMTISGASDTRQTNSTGSNSFPTWNLAGTEIYFETDRNSGVFQIYKVGFSGGSETQITTNTAYNKRRPWIGYAN